jgi:putative aldouronate transport system substrate-binding protein
LGISGGFLGCAGGASSQDPAAGGTAVQTLPAGSADAQPAPSSATQAAGMQPEPSSSASTEPPRGNSALISSEPLTLTYFIKMAEKPAEMVTDYNEMPNYKKIEEETGIHIEFIHSPVGAAGSEIDLLNMLVASNDIPDLIFLDWNQYPGGLVKAMQEGLAVPLNDKIASLSPTFASIIANDPQIDRDVKTDDGSYYYYPILRPDSQVRMWYGGQVRGDWLEKVNLGAPKTIGDWHAMLAAFKENDMDGDGDASNEIPFTSPILEGLRQFTGAWGIGGIAYYLDGPVVKYAPVQPAFKEYLAVMNTWYSEGLIDQNFAVTDGAAMLAKITSNTVGSFFGSLSGNMGRGNLELKQQNEEYELIGVQYPIQEGGGYGFGLQSNFRPKALSEGATITSANKHVDESMRWLDFHYSEKGGLLMNVGVEGLSWEYKDGVPTYTDLVTRNPDGLAPTIAMGYYAMGGDQHDVMLCELYQFQQMSLSTPQQASANELWSKADFDMIMPGVTPNAEEIAILSNIATDIKTYSEEMITKFIMGVEPMGNFESFTANLENMGVNDAVAIYQAAYDRYTKR